MLKRFKINNNKKTYQENYLYLLPKFHELLVFHVAMHYQWWWNDTKKKTFTFENFIILRYI